jgi:L-asparaginase / beta-aspartyl-peptidase
LLTTPEVISSPRATPLALAAVALGLALAAAGCRAPESRDEAGPLGDGPLGVGPLGGWALAIHGGAGTLDRNASADRLQAYEASLSAALAHGRQLLTDGMPAIEVVEAVVRRLEDDPLFNAGVGAVFNERGEHELDASIMDGATLRCGAVAGVRTVKNPITLARLVMTSSPHVLLAGAGAEQFADVVGVERVDNTHFDTEHRRRALDEALRARGASASRRDPRSGYGTVGCVARDVHGNLAAATSTGGMTAKRWGRVGDAPVIGAGNYADGYAAVSCTGTGEEFIRHAVARSVTARLQFAGQSLEAAANAVVHEVLQPDDGGLIAVDRGGRVVMPFNSTGMYRGMADSTGRFRVAIFAD